MHHGKVTKRQLQGLHSLHTSRIQAKITATDEEGDFYDDKGSAHQKDTVIISRYVLNEVQTHEANLREPKRNRSQYLETSRA